VHPQIREQLGALAIAHDARVLQQSASHLSHAITLAVLDACAFSVQQAKA
jgi:hypothetical protein